MPTALARRDELIRDQLAHLPFGSRPIVAPPVRVGVSGSGPSLLLLAWSADDLARERAAGVRILRCLGIAPGMRVANTLPGALATPGSLLLGDVVEELGGLDVPLGEVAAQAAGRQAWELIDRVEPEVLVLAPSTAPLFLAAAPAATRPWWRGIVRVAVGAALPELDVPAAAGFGGWQRTWLAVPEVTSFVAGSCRAGRFHVDEGVGAEVLDAATGAALPAGREGELVLALPGSTARRYASGIRAHLADTACACGESGRTLELA